MTSNLPQSNNEDEKEKDEDEHDGQHDIVEKEEIVYVANYGYRLRGDRQLKPKTLKMKQNELIFNGKIRIDLSSINIIRHIMKRNDKFGFEIITSQKSYSFWTMHSHERLQWIQSITLNLKNNACYNNHNDADADIGDKLNLCYQAYPYTSNNKTIYITLNVSSNGKITGCAHTDDPSPIQGFTKNEGNEYQIYYDYQNDQITMNLTKQYGIWNGYWIQGKDNDEQMAVTAFPVDFQFEHSVLQGYLYRTIGHDKNHNKDKLYFKLTDHALEFSKFEPSESKNDSKLNLNHLHSSNICGAVFVPHIVDVKLLKEKHFVIMFDENDNKKHWILTPQKTDTKTAMKWVEKLKQVIKRYDDIY